MSNTEKIALARKQQGGKDLGGEEGVLQVTKLKHP